jgi:POT family proton-dependent oligopeptide transporter
MMLTQRFAPEDQRRESAFLWNYAGMNIGFFIGFSVAGHYQETEAYSPLFVFATVGNFFAIVLALFNWKVLADRKTPLLESTNAQFRARFAIGIAILFGVPLVVWFMLHYTGPTGIVLKAASGAVAGALIYLTIRHPHASERKKMWAYLILTLGSLVFWSLYQMAPNGLQLFAVHNVHLRVWGIEVAPQWVQNINTIVIVLGGPLLAALFTRLRARRWKIDIPQQFAVSLILMALGFLALPVGIAFADASGRSPFFWLFASYVLQSIGELLISPIGYAMIGKLAPSKYQGIMMGTWMLVTGLASLFAGDFSGMVPEPTGTTAIATNPEYSKLFSRLGWGSFIAGVALIALIPLLRKLIQDSPAPTQRAAEAAGTTLCS